MADNKTIMFISFLLFLIGCNRQSDYKRHEYELSDSICAFGIDLSHHNSKIEWNKLEVDFVYLKATEGSSFKDPKYLEYRDSCIKNNISIGAYHFFSCNVSGYKQFKNFKNTVKDKFDLHPVLDVETCNIPKKKLQEEVSNWIIECYNHYKVYPIIYTSDSFYIHNLKGNETIENCHVWLGDIGTYAVRTPHLMRQFKIEKINGTKYPVDCNSLYVSINEIKIKK